MVTPNDYCLSDIVFCCPWFVEEISSESHYIDSARRIARGAATQANDFEEIAESVASQFGSGDVVKNLLVHLRRAANELREMRVLIETCINAQEASNTLFWAARKLSLGKCSVNTQLEQLALEKQSVAHTAQAELSAKFSFVQRIMPPPLHPLGLI